VSCNLAGTPLAETLPPLMAVDLRADVRLAVEEELAVAHDDDRHAGHDERPDPSCAGLDSGPVTVSSQPAVACTLWVAVTVSPKVADSFPFDDHDTLS
jgi:hypothetical protein